jgi:uncharacterized membrane protein SpoIIM required for sporulation
MANTVVASTSDVNSGYWNPAGLQLEEKQVALMHASYFANIAQYDYLAYASQSMIGLWSINALIWVDDILNTTELIDSERVI